MKYKAVLFDLDGTLLNTLQDLAEAVNFGLNQMGFPQHELEEYKCFIGAGREVLAKLALPEANRDQSTQNRLIVLMEEYYNLHWTDHTRVYPGVPEMLDGLTGSGIRMAILSNKPNKFTELNAGILLSQWHFTKIVGSLPGVPKKPDPTAALQIAGQMQIQPSRFLYLGDSGIDMQTAVAAGMYPVGAAWGFRTRDELRSCGAKTLIEQPPALLDILKSIA